MAEAVHKLLEEMLPELDEFQHKGIFSAAEIKAIVKRRTDFEYALRKRTTKRNDYIRYIAYEMNLNQLREKRKKRLGIMKKNAVSDYSIIRRVHFIYRRLLRKFGSDPKLWVQYFDFCKRNESTRLLGRAMADALAIHPRVPALWVEAAKYEFEERGDIKSARALMQRGLRLNGKSKELWLEYFRLENMFHEKVILRRRILKLPVPEDDDDTGTPMDVGDEDVEATALDGDEEKDGIISLLPPAQQAHKQRKEAHMADKKSVHKPSHTMEVSESEDSDASGTEDEQEGDDESDTVDTELVKTDGMDRFLRREVPALVYQNAIKIYPDDLEYRKAFLDIYRLFDGSQKRQAEIYDSLRTDFSTKPQMWDLLARREFVSCGFSDDKEGQSKAVEVYKEGLARTHDKPTMYTLYIAFLYEQADLAAVKDVCRRSYQDKKKKGVTQVDVYVMWVNAALRTRKAVEKKGYEGSLRDPLVIMRCACEEHPSSVEVWAWRVRVVKTLMKEKHGGDVVQVLAAMTELYEQALKQVSKATGVWVDYLSCLLAAEKLGECDDVFACALLALPCSSERDTMIVQHCTDAYSTSIPAGRSVLRALKTHRVSMACAQLQRCIRLEVACLSSDRDFVVEMYEFAVSLNPVSAGPWLSYLGALYSYKRFDLAAKIHARAGRAVGDVGEFEASSTQLIKSLS